ncbi:D-alanyl-lipoteichoic acid biosynthesis protein DltD [Enterococcus columbae]|uniref:Protein DltD n=1 Tax=Enterococcus columbae DSM 7374 = ATCC 51263 TaxID=1121865 RepID=S1NEJ1_9ENTE|nr:D-alanyl-lipoteichoic acid biosynthesis protein DltD [Enterococcus columbae]EOT40350.1 D-alanyl-lipoteichoic acid biosynthesis protein DltD [Enterococcus columbae DSM 7374 = ATCC 51263]EOW84088.1 D-alanyl-lipoteichoic acid biosynthesis protein DltD [Enterococcus columbae DSM 7374 = ATCC 51263]OJG25385.1 D-alanyl-lipoteichoic acid biosynthesis protein DltD [Enterococcus columbae DSM 7374 = ATCC 51263]
MKAKLWTIFGPICAALVLLAGLFFSPIDFHLVNQKEISQAATSMSAQVIKGNAIKNRAFEEKHYVPFFGSSELSRISAFHPSTLAEKYQRGYVPFLLGAPGTQSLTHFLMLQSMGKELSDKKIVFVLSPQWFVPTGVTTDYFDRYFSKQQTYQWLAQLTTINQEDQYFAKRLLNYQMVQKDWLLYPALQKVANGQYPSHLQLLASQLMENFYKHEDQLFGGLDLISKQEPIEKAKRILPKAYSYEKLDQLAYQIGSKRVGNTPFMIDRHYYQHKIRPLLHELKGAQQTFDYRYSPEFSDFELVLATMAKYHIQPLFIIPPVNQEWSNYTGLSQEMLQQFAEKIKFQLTSQGFTNIADFTNQANTPYFLQDTIHLGWRGWLASDQYIRPFLMQSMVNQAPKYKIQDYFFSNQWQEANPTQLQILNKTA